MVCLQFLDAIGTLLVAIFAACIAYQQHKTSRERLRLDLYDKRFNVYSTVRDVLVKVTMIGSLAPEDYSRLFEQADNARFLFPNTDVETFLKNVVADFAQLELQEREFDASPHMSQQSSDASQAIVGLKSELAKRRDHMHEVFYPFMRIRL